MDKRTPVAAVAAVLALAACGSDPGEPDGETIGDPGGEISGTVTFWHAFSADSPEVSTLEEIVIPSFVAQHPDVTIEAVPMPYDDMHQQLVTAVAGGALPDLVRSDIIWVPELADLGVLMPLDEEMPDFAELAGGVYEGPLAANLWQGHYYGLPLGTNTRVLLYNSDALAAAGFDAPPATFEDMREMAPAFTGTDTYLFADNSTAGWNVLPWIWSAGGELTDPDVTVASGYLDSPESVAGVELLVDLYQAGAIPEIILGGEGGTATSDGLQQGQYATILDGPWMFPIFEAQFPDFEFETAMVPAGPGGSISVVGGESIVLTRSSQNPEAAAEFMRHLLSEESQRAFAEAGQMSALVSLGDELAGIRPYYEPFVEQIATARARTVTPAWPRIEEVLRQQVQLALRGELTSQEALDQAAVEIDALLAQYQG